MFHFLISATRTFLSVSTFQQSSAVSLSLCFFPPWHIFFFNCWCFHVLNIIKQSSFICTECSVAHIFSVLVPHFHTRFQQCLHLQKKVH
jgi:hypothetical protein